MSEAREYTIRAGRAEDMQAVLNLIRELAAYEKAADQVSVSVEQLVHDGFEEKRFDTLLAEKNGEIVGMAFYYPRYSTWKGKTVYLEDLIVKESCRRCGIGRALFEAVLETAQVDFAARMEWQVLAWNEPAIRFYEKLNAEIDQKWLNGKIVLK